MPVPNFHDPGVSETPDVFAPHTVGDLVCFSHLRWDFVFQRPQHLLTRASRRWRVWYVEEPVWCETLRLEVRAAGDRIKVIVPHLPHGIDDRTAERLQRQLINQWMERERISDFIAWYFTPMALLYTEHLRPSLTVYDCMDELSAFSGASPLLLEQEQKLLKRAHLVYTGGHSLYEAKQPHHPHVFAFPSCIDFRHFAQSRDGLPDPLDQSAIPGPRIGFCGVIDERLDLELLKALAERRPDWHFVLLGPVVKIDPAALPQGPNLHYLGMKNYNELPAYFSNWQAALLPFALNESTRYISPTKTPEYLAAGLPVISTPIRDVVRSYGGWGPVLIGNSVSAFEEAVERSLARRSEVDWAGVDKQLKTQSWDNAWQQMQRLIEARLLNKFENR
ncbi:glycosyltransferase [Larkinella soli]|uniref:glycosyltransferase n=1 Tax=Larkinella soli TaxID=1770527 RepID=UPI000FFC017E|nr:glycosyltransferase [Larkinella soli]